MRSQLAEFIVETRKSLFNQRMCSSMLRLNFGALAGDSSSAVSISTNWRRRVPVFERLGLLVG